jgi:hypothetical protein
MGELAKQNRPDKLALAKRANEGEPGALDPAVLGALPRLKRIISRLLGALSRG